MGDIFIRTERLDLILESPEAVLARIETMNPTDRAEVSPDWLARMRKLTAPDPWVQGFAIVDRTLGRVVGSGGFKGPPDTDGIVEVAYCIEPDYRKRGYASEAARAMTDFALSSELVRLVCAHTKSDNEASTRVLLKCGFMEVGEVIDPEDGLVCRWERVRETI